MSIHITKSFKVDQEIWANFLKVAESYGATPAELLREFVKHADAIVKAIESKQVQSFNGDVSKFIRNQFPEISPYQLRQMANILMQASKVDIKINKEKDEISQIKNK